MIQPQLFHDHAPWELYSKTSAQGNPPTPEGEYDEDVSLDELGFIAARYFMLIDDEPFFLHNGSLVMLDEGDIRALAKSACEWISEVVVYDRDYIDSFDSLMYWGEIAAEIDKHLPKEDAGQ
jgi:hypothetical protein